MAKMVMRKFYRQADGYPERLPWHRNEPGPLLERVIAARNDRLSQISIKLQST